MENTYTLITGASAGFGAEFARQLAAQGHNLVITARREERLRKLKAEIEKTSNVKIEIIPADLSKLPGIRKLVSEIKHKKIKIDFLVNNAGFGRYGDFTGFDYPELENLIHVNINALTYLTLEFLPQMKKDNSGSILFVSSQGAFMAVPALSVYAATKAYVLNLAMAIADELKGSNIRIGILCPGPASTEFFDVAQYGKHLTARHLLDPVEVVRQGIQGIKTGKLLIVPGLLQKIQVFSTRLLSRKLYTNIAGKIIRKMK